MCVVPLLKKFLPDNNLSLKVKLYTNLVPGLPHLHVLRARYNCVQQRKNRGGLGRIIRSLGVCPISDSRIVMRTLGYFALPGVLASGYFCFGQQRCPI